MQDTQATIVGFNLGASAYAFATASIAARFLGMVGARKEARQALWYWWAATFVWCVIWASQRLNPTGLELEMLFLSGINTLLLTMVAAVLWIAPDWRRLVVSVGAAVLMMAAFVVVSKHYLGREVCSWTFRWLAVLPMPLLGLSLKRLYGNVAYAMGSFGLVYGLLQLNAHDVLSHVDISSLARMSAIMIAPLKMLFALVLVHYWGCASRRGAEGVAVHPAEKLWLWLFVANVIFATSVLALVFYGNNDGALVFLTVALGLFFGVAVFRGAYRHTPQTRRAAALALQALMIVGAIASIVQWLL